VAGPASNIIFDGQTSPPAGTYAGGTIYVANTSITSPSNPTLQIALMWVFVPALIGYNGGWTQIGA
jgi:hypothetical protein